MNVEIISATPNPIDTMWIAARTCYSSQSPLQMLHSGGQKSHESKWKLIKGILESGHESIAEHINFTFGIEGISRACSHQLVRHRHCTISQQSQRYVEIKEEYDTIKQLVDNCTNDDEEIAIKACVNLKDIIDKYFAEVTNANSYTYAQYLLNYLQETQQNYVAAENARMLLPNATKTNLVITCNLRQLTHMCNLRLCIRAQKEIRDLFKLIKEQVTQNYNENIGQLLVSQCDKLGYCPEGTKCCGKKKTLQDILKCNKE